VDIDFKKQAHADPESICFVTAFASPINAHPSLTK